MISIQENTFVNVICKMGIIYLGLNVILKNVWYFNVEAW